MKTSIVVLSIFIGAVFSILTPASARADHDQTVFDRHCGYYHSSRDFVQKASLYCLGKPNRSDTKDCVEHAKEYFHQCSFRGDYERISTEVHAGMLFMLVLAGAPEVSHLKHES
jgi:hypothetical protein